jgi:hypothetical protein
VTLGLDRIIAPIVLRASGRQTHCFATSAASGGSFSFRAFPGHQSANIDVTDSRGGYVTGANLVIDGGFGA